MDVIPHSSEPSDSQILQKMQQVGIIYTHHIPIYMKIKIEVLNYRVGWPCLSP